MDLRAYLHIAPEVDQALSAGRPVLALSTTDFARCLSGPEGLVLAHRVEEIVRTCGAVPAPVAVLNGALTVGLSHSEWQQVCSGEMGKASRRDLPVLLAGGGSGAATAAASMLAACLAGIRVFSAGAIGGVSARGVHMDVSADLQEIRKTPVAVVCAGIKCGCSIPLTLEYLETMGVTVLGAGTNRFPGFLTTEGPELEYPAQSPHQLARAARIKWDIGLSGGLLYCTRPDKALAAPVYEQAQRNAMDEADRQGICGSARTPFLLKNILESSEDARTVYTQAVLASARAGAEIAVEYAQL
ncbi:pseudouridine-5'-phosphate glycosidase [uncultured Ruthenibacterium sp.]|uniref:pseudouridine-5'-phosphate glycosidase n=1 Tax=uncultured Ruthenibacterium sp. TaxID=1905347 RepID=UPI00349F03DC